ncbi:phospholipase A [Glaciecola sp. 2405UD65-10]|uniref:phospholipase A n=1 Tax=Glaciecola sp. 2405UD65-10 TaxID=3397244 RepID=UPI003B5BC9BA
MFTSSYSRIVPKMALLLCCSAGAFSAHAQDAQQEDDAKPKDVEVITVKPGEPNSSIYEERILSDKEANENLFSMSQHWPNYILPVSHVSDPNSITLDGEGEEVIDNLEAKYQISVKTPLWTHNDDFSGLYFGFTAMSLWQLYNSETSKPFRETNYEPELFYMFDTDIKILGYQFNLMQIGLNHQSNGQNGLKSRSWNRITVSALFSDEDTAYFVRTWYRIPEDDKEFPLDPRGDDNPDINDYYGRIEIGFSAQFGRSTVTTRLRNNLRFDDNRGGIEINYTYPINARYDFLIQYFNGYGDSLIDYNRHQKRISAGVQLKFL